MTQVLQSPPHLTSPSNPCGQISPDDDSQPNALTDNSVEEHLGAKERDNNGEGDQLSFLTLLVAVFRKSLVTCSSCERTELSSNMEIGCPSDVRHVAHVTFDRFNGFLGLPVEFEPEVPRRAPSASASVFGVSTESMQLSFDARGNSVPTILLLMQRHLYAQGGLQAEGIFRIAAGNSQEEYVREQLNRGVVPDGVDVHCLAGLIKAWFRELPTGVLDPLSPEQVMQAQSEEECAQLVRLLPPTEAALLDWAINLMADVAQLENLNKMNARNVAMVFAPNMTQMADPLIALMHAVQVMNFLRTLVVKTLREREESIKKSNPVSNLDSFDDDESQSSPRLTVNNYLTEDDSDTESGSKNMPTSTDIMDPIVGNKLLIDRCPCDVVSQVHSLRNGLQDSNFTGMTNTMKCSKEVVEVPVPGQPLGKNRGTAIVGRINSRKELVEAWR